MPLREQQFLVYLYDRLVGRLHRRENLTRFAFEPNYWPDAERAVLGLRFENDPLARHRSNLRLPPWFSNLLPEGRLREWIARASHASVDVEIDLLAQVGHDLPGAVRVLVADRAVAMDLSGGEARNGAHESTPDSGLWRFSLAGVGLKFSLLASGDRLTIPAVGEAGDWIVKLPDTAFPDLARNEAAMMNLARAVGIAVPEVRLVHRDQIEGLPDRVWPASTAHAYAVRRFDRGPARELIHIEDLAQVRGFYPERKYNGSYETVAALLYRGQDVDSLREFARRLCFNSLIGNGDAHLKNWSVIYRDRRTPSLAPAYDLVATFPYRPRGEGPEDMALRFGGSKHFDAVRPSAFARLDERLEAGGDLAEVAREVARRVGAEWPRAREWLADVPELRSALDGFVRERLERFIG